MKVSLIVLAGLVSVCHNIHARQLTGTDLTVAYHRLLAEASPAQFADIQISQLNEINCALDPASCVHKVAWYLDRDNSMSPVSSKEGVGAAMAIAVTKSGYSQAVQVCPGVYLATAHGILDDPEEAQKK